MGLGPMDEALLISTSTCSKRSRPRRTKRSAWVASATSPGRANTWVSPCSSSATCSSAAAPRANGRAGVELHGALADAQGTRDLLAGQAVGEQAQPLALAGGQPAAQAGRAYRGDRLGRERWFQGRATGGDGADRPRDFR